MTDCFPILGGTSIDQLKSNIEALKIVLTEQQTKKLNDASPFDHGYPTGQFGLDPRLLPGQQPETNMLNTVSRTIHVGTRRLTYQAVSDTLGGLDGLFNESNLPAPLRDVCIKC